MLSKLCCPQLLSGLHFKGSALTSGVPIRKSQTLGKGKGVTNLWSFTIKSWQRNPDENIFISYLPHRGLKSTFPPQVPVYNIVILRISSLMLEIFLMKSTLYTSIYFTWPTQNLNYTTHSSVYIFMPEFQSFIISNNQKEPLQSFHQLDSLLFSLESDSKDIPWHVTHDRLWLIRQRGNTNENEAPLSSPLHYDTCRLEPEDGLWHCLCIHLNKMRGCIWLKNICERGKK